MKASAKAKLSREIRDMLSESAPIEFQDRITIDLMGEGEHLGKTNARVIAEEVLKLARSGDKWAIEFVAERAEGKAVPITDGEDATRIVEEALSDVTRNHLNDLARSIDPTAPVGANPLVTAIADRVSDEDDGDVADASAGPTSPLLDLPEDGDSGSEDDGR